MRNIHADGRERRRIGENRIRYGYLDVCLVDKYFNLKSSVLNCAGLSAFRLNRSLFNSPQLFKNVKSRYVHILIT